ncbi:unnamed protein product [Heterobilharzia americana]|nr:unnamed protein product [Heterobilharzia americana]CAH8533387.1 unnamed protein product [Heterobilharzia americana]
MMDINGTDYSSSYQKRFELSVANDLLLNQHDHIHHHHDHQHGSPHTIGNEGLFLSHSYLGSFIICLGLWWWIQALRRCYASSKRNHRTQEYTATISYPSFCCKSRLGEAYCKIIFCVIGIGVELLTLKFNRHHEYAHFPFYTAMIIASLLDVLIATILAPPYGMDYVAHALPFFIQACCLRAHSYQQPLVTQTCRLLLSYWSWFTGSSIVNEMLLNKSIIWTWIKCFGVIFQGTWIWQTGILLNPPSGRLWDENNHNSLMYSVIIFVWHMFFVMIGQLVVLLIVAKCYHTSPDWTLTDPISLSTSSTVYKHDKMSSNGQNSINSHDKIEYTKLLNSDDVEM